VDEASHDGLGLSEEEGIVRDTVRRFAEEEILPRVVELDHRGGFPGELVRGLAEQGMLGIAIPEQYDGAGMSGVALALVVEELAKVSGSLAHIVAVHGALCAGPLLDLGTEAQKKEHLPALASGEVLGTLAMTEAGAESDLGATEAAALRSDGGFELSGTKTWVPHASGAQLFLVLARTGPGPRGGGLSLFLLPGATPGLAVADPDDTLGLRNAAFCSVTLECCKVPEAGLLGTAGGGLEQLDPALARARGLSAALSLGLAEGALARALQYSREREAFERPIAGHQAIAFKLADMSTQIEAARHLVLSVARAADRGRATPEEAARAKLFASETAVRVASDAVQIHGGYGFTREYHVERYYRDAKVCTIDQGTSEMQRLLISRALLQEDAP